MYSRTKSGREIFSDKFTVPKNYSGSAFFDDRTPYEPPREKESDIVISPKNDSEETVNIIRESSPVNAESNETFSENNHSKEHILSKLGFEDLLIIGIILILSGSEADDDILLMLSLILAYKK